MFTQMKEDIRQNLVLPRNLGNMEDKLWRGEGGSKMRDRNTGEKTRRDRN